MTAVLTAAPPRRRRPCAAPHPPPASASSRCVAGGGLDELDQLEGRDRRVGPVRQPPALEGRRGVLLLGEGAFLRDDDGADARDGEVGDAVLPGRADDDGAAGEERPRVVDPRGRVVSDRRHAPPAIPQLTRRLVTYRGLEHTTEQQHRSVLDLTVGVAPVEARDPAGPDHAIAVGREAVGPYGTVRPGCDDAVGQIVGEGVRGVGARPGLRHSDGAQAEQAHERDHLGADVHDERLQVPVHRGRGDHRESSAVSRVGVRSPVQRAARGRVGVAGVDGRAVGAVERVGVRGSSTHSTSGASRAGRASDENATTGARR